MLIDTTKGQNKVNLLDKEIKTIMATIKHKIDNNINTCNNIIITRLNQIAIEIKLIELEINQNPINN